MPAPDEERQRQADILRYWRAVEYFSPPQVDRVDARKNVYAASARWPLPWETGSELPPAARNCVWRHTVYAGIFEISGMRDLLLEVFRSPGEENDLDGRVSGQSALLSFGVDDSGQLIRDSVTLSSCGWAVSRTLSPGPGSAVWLSGFEFAAAQMLTTLLAVGDGRVTVERRPSADAPGAGAGSALGPIAGVTSRLVLSAATGGISGLAATVGAGLGPIVGPAVTNVINQVGDELATAAVNKVAKSLSKGPSSPSAKAAAAREDGEDTDAEPDDETGEGSSAEPPRAVGTKVLDVYDLAAIARWVAEELGVADVLKPNEIRVKSYQVSEKHADEARGDEILNSFYADDLEVVAHEAVAGRIGAALGAYLSADRSLDRLPRIDVRRSPATVLEHLQPSAIPLGRWPAEADQPLALSQQFAINRILQSLGDPEAAGIYAVNGPPGTGKTTMLRDLIAALVVKRAERLVTLRRASDVFVGEPLSWQTESSFKPTLHALRPELAGFEMVIASSNNGAVENVTLEVPGAKAVGASWLAEADYLSGPASLALEAPAWGAIAARLGRRNNRSEFVERFWWSKQGKESAKRGADREADSDDPYAGSGLDELLKRQPASHRPRRAAADADDFGALPTPPLGELTWAEAKEKFKQAHQKVVRLAAERQRISELAARLEHPDAELWDLNLAAGDAWQRANTIAMDHIRAAELVEQREQEQREREVDLNAARSAVAVADQAAGYALWEVRQAEQQLWAWEAQNRRPGWVKRTFSRTAEQSWAAGQAPFLAVLMSADERFRFLDAALRDAENAAREVQCRLDHARMAAHTARRAALDQHRRLSEAVALRAATEQQVEARERTLAAERAELARARDRWGAAVPGDEWCAPPGDQAAMERRELSAPWMDREFAQARTRLFLAALDLHRAVLANAPGRARESLSAAMDVVKGKAPAELPGATVLAAWQVLFFFVPVVSTTFASAGRMFAGLGPESLGWLLVDEAGQATPQAVVGALWRSRRAVVVGDPLQLEPVVTLPHTGQARLREHFGVAPEWLPGKTSVQARADRLTVHGTWLPSRNGPTWVGSPLRVHRRCDRMMFEVSNAIAYDGMMVYGARETPGAYPLANANVWLNVPSPAQGGKWNPAEGKLVQRSLDLIWERIPQILDAEIDDPEIETPWARDRDSYAREHRRRFGESVFVISPFREVVHGLRQQVPAVARLPEKRVGTVHRTQGKEADVVILVLGTAAGQSGSRDWAAHTPNLVNVAVTRARRRLIVIGDHAAWSKHRYFKDLADHRLLAVRDR